jgi:hypothetical protein
MNGIARFFDTHGGQWQWLSLTQIMNLKKNIFIEFPCISLSNLNMLNTENIFF